MDLTGHSFNLMICDYSYFLLYSISLCVCIDNDHSIDCASIAIMLHKAIAKFSQNSKKSYLSAIILSFS